MQYSFAVLLSFVIALVCSQSIASSLPIVDLGYAVHQATLNVSSLRSALIGV